LWCLEVPRELVVHVVVGRVGGIVWIDVGVVQAVQIDQNSADLGVRIGCKAFSVISRIPAAGG
jgi:hypothetical protein